VASPIVSQSVCSPVVSAGTPPRPHATVYEIVTNQILAALEQGEVPWHKPWQSLPPTNLITKKPYRGINVFLLGFAGYGSQFWLTFNQAKQLGGNVRKGEHGTKIIFWKCKTREMESADGEIEERKSAFLRYYTVFNLEQTEGLSALLTLPPAFPIESAEEIVKGMPNPPAFEQDSRAAYIPSRDTVTMPSRTAFQSQAEFYSTLFHELVHSTGHGKRLGREGIEKIQPFGSEDYSQEELVAEMGSAMLCGAAGIEQATIGNSVAYLQSWINRLKADSRLVISAARAAQAAADYILGESEKDSPASDGRFHAS
jgi:antirestriction protein ArdC